MSSAQDGIHEIRTRDLGRAFDEHYALIGLNAVFPAGTATAILGPNGAGKSTLIGMLSTRQSPTEGEVIFGDGLKGPMLRSLISYVGHRTMVYTDLSARENLDFFAKMFGLTDMHARIDALLDEVGLQHAKDRPVAGFSRGMAQRLTLARALLPNPGVLLLDEPLTGLDQAGVEDALALFGKVRDRGAIVIMASHDLAATNQLVDRALVLVDGRKAYEGPVQGDLVEVYQRAVGGT
jgi:heme exporter protein A